MISFSTLFSQLDLDPHPSLDSDEQRFMFEALKEAFKAFQEGEVPVGAVVVHKGRVIARGYNQVERLKDATAHAEMLALTSASNYLENWRLKGTTLYSTLEPCTMCLGACYLSRIDHLVWATADHRHGACGSWVDLLKASHPTHSLTTHHGPLAIYAERLLKHFFKQRRKNHG